MSGETDTDRPPTLPKLGLASAAILGALATYFAALLLLVLMDVVFGSTWVLTAAERSRLGGQIVPAVAFLGTFTVLPGGGLRLLARRYQSPAIQAGALIGAGGMSVVYLFKILFDPAVGSGPIVLLVLLGLGLLVGVAAVSSNPAREPGERTGIDALREGLIAGSKRLRERWRDRSASTGEHARAPPQPTTNESTGSSHSVSTRRYWLVVGIAFLLFLPISLVDPALGVGLLSAFLTAYTFSKQIEAQSTTVPDDHSSEDG